MSDRYPTSRNRHTGDPCSICGKELRSWHANGTDICPGCRRCAHCGELLASHSLAASLECIYGDRLPDPKAMVPTGNACLINLGALRPFGPGGTEKGIALNPEDWARLSSSEQERVREYVVRHSVEDGFRALERFLRDAGRDTSGDGR